MQPETRGSLDGIHCNISHTPTTCKTRIDILKKLKTHKRAHIFGQVPTSKQHFPRPSSQGERKYHRMISKGRSRTRKDLVYNSLCALELLQTQKGLNKATELPAPSLDFRAEWNYFLRSAEVE